ncbi:hypothetical protein GOODEAATRI_017635, partial [Goodea atripinnis]
DFCSFLEEELRKLREETNVDSLRQELERERSKRLDLEQKMNEVLRTRLEDSPPQPPRKQQSPSNNGTEKRQKEVWSSRLQKWLYERFGDYIEDFRFQPEENTVETEEPLNLHECCLAWLGHSHVPVPGHPALVFELPHCQVTWLTKSVFMKLGQNRWFMLFYFSPQNIFGVYAGIKFFIIDFMFKSCPKLRDKYDTPYIVWNSLPTDPQLKERTNATVSRRLSCIEKVGALVCPPPHPLVPSTPSVPVGVPQAHISKRPVVSRSSLAAVPSGMSREDDTGRSHSTKKGPFHEIFNLSESERPLAGKETYYNQ